MSFLTAAPAASVGPDRAGLLRARLQALRVEREARGELVHGLEDADADFLRLRLVQHGGDEARDLPHLLLAHAARGERGRSQTDAGGDEGLVGVERDGVLVGGYPRGFERLLG